MCFGNTVVGKIPRSLVSGLSPKVDVNLESIEIEPSLATTVEPFQSNQLFGVVVKSQSKICKKKRIGKCCTWSSGQ